MIHTCRVSQTIEQRVQPPGSRTRLDWKPILIVLVAAAGLLAVIHTWGGSSSSKWVEVAHGKRHGVYWQLDIAEKNGQLCMSVDGAAGPSHPGRSFSGACGFENAPDKAAFYYASGLGPADMDVNFGPLPTSATRIQVATNLILLTHPLPDVSGMPDGRWWMQLVPRNGSFPARDGRIFNTARPLDDAGHVVAWQRF